MVLVVVARISLAANRRGWVNTETHAPCAQGDLGSSGRHTASLARALVGVVGTAGRRDIGGQLIRRLPCTTARRHPSGFESRARACCETWATGRLRAGVIARPAANSEVS